MIAPGIAATLLISIILSYNEFLLASALSQTDAARTLTVGVSLFQGERLENSGQMAVASLAGYRAGLCPRPVRPSAGW